MTTGNTRESGKWWITAVVLLAIAVLPFLPFLSGKTINAADTVKSIPFMRWSLGHLANGEIGQWIPGLFGGMPAFASLVTAPVNPLEVGLLVFGANVLFDGYADPVLPHIVYLLILGLGTFLYVRDQGVSRPGGLLLAGLAMSMTTLVGLAGAGHTVKLWTLCQIPLSMFLLGRVFRDGRWLQVLLAGFAVGLLLLSKHVQVAYYFLLAAGLVFLVKALLEFGLAGWRQLVDRLGKLLVSVCLGLLLSAVLFLPVLNYSEYSIRSGSSENVVTGGYAAAYSYPPGDVLSWAIPAAKGFGGQDYWGALEYTAFPLAMGVVPVVLLVLALLSPGWRRSLPLVVAALFLFLLGIGEHGPFFGLFVDVLPYYAKFRAHMWAIAVGQILLVLAAAGALRELLPAAKGSPAATLLQRAGLACLVCAALMAVAALSVTPGKGGIADGDSRFTERDRLQIETYFKSQGRNLSPAEFNQVKNSIRESRGKVQAAGFWKEAVVVMLLGGVLVLRSRGVVKEGQALILLLGLGLADAWPEYNRTLDFETRTAISRELEPDPMIQHLQQLQAGGETFRVWPAGVYGYNQLVAWDLHSVLGYQGARLKVADELLDAGRDEGYGMDREIHPHVLDLLNVKYTIAKGVLPGHTPVGKLGDQVLLARETAAERISFPARITKAASEDEALQRILAPDFDARTEMVLTGETGIAGNPAATARLTRYTDHVLEIAAEISGPAVMQISEIWYPNGWTATVDGVATPILRSNFGTRAVVLPAAGSHKVELRFAPRDFRVAKWISLGTALAMGIATALLVMVERRKAGKGGAA